MKKIDFFLKLSSSRFLNADSWICISYKLWFALFLLSASVCIASPAEILSPLADEGMSRRGQVFSFKPVDNATQYYVYIGSSIGALDIQSINLGLNTSFKVSDIPSGIDNVHIRLWSFIDARWVSNSYVYHVNRQQYYPSQNGSVNLHNAQLWGAAWSTPVAYSEDSSNINCSDLQSDIVSSCMETLNVNSMGASANTQYRKDQYVQAVGGIAGGALTALVNIKLKAWALEEGAYCQITLKVGQNIEQLNESDYVDHIEVFGDQNWRLSGRHISYLAIPIPLNINGDFVIQINKEIIGACEVSVAFNVLGINK